MKKRAPARRSAKVTSADSGSASERAYSLLLDQILSGALAPDERLTESEVASHLALGKTPAREALRRLVFEGFATLQPRNGYKVASITLQGVEELCGLRLVAEPAAVALSAGRLTTPQLAELTKMAKVTYDPRHHHSIQNYLKVNREFHGLIVSACGNTRLSALVDQLHFESYRIFQVQLMHYPDNTHHKRLHEDLVKALRAGDAAVARKLSEREIIASRTFIIESLLRNPALRSLPMKGAR